MKLPDSELRIWQYDFAECGINLTFNADFIYLKFANGNSSTLVIPRYAASSETCEQLQAVLDDVKTYLLTSPER
ncbi:MAG: hypothetical protein JXQ72_16545 [Anaerolineae bacterium]|nr:hypothetical protein [Anaerolineae bacterium]